MTGRVFRALVTGTEEWPWPQVIYRALDELRARLAPDDVLVVVHGACAGGADLHAAQWARRHRDNPTPDLAAVREEAHPADWENCRGPRCTPQHRKRRRDGVEYCPSAGHLRNQEMVDSRPDLWLGFCLNDSPGTEGCIRACRRARLDGHARYAYRDIAPAA